MKSQKSKEKKNRKYYKWVVIITVWTFFLTIGFNLISDALLADSSILQAFIILIVIIFLGVFFDMVGIAVAAADLTPFNAMASNRVVGAKEAVNIVKNASQVSNFCNDVIGDICGIISGATSIIIIYQLQSKFNLVEVGVIVIVLNGFVAALTVGGKAFGKEIALKNSTSIVYRLSYIVFKFRDFFSIK